MTTVTLTINEHRIPLRDDIDVAALTEEIVEAVRGGGNFIHVDDTRGQSFEVLVTPHSRAMITQSEPILDMVPPENGWAQSLELDF
ncbi:hypothetical protein [Microcella indica]|jgi:hypothetical protein|uniref:hypothetical protein n=1 Tax=Microcella indica TaxID=2750620 RepID=UPI0015CF5899|nr:hypothetical protein [Microcella indica]